MSRLRVPFALFAIATALLLVSTACEGEPIELSATELMERTETWREPKVAIWYYQGTEDRYHYFKFSDLGINQRFRTPADEFPIEATFPLSDDPDKWRVMPWGPASQR